MQNERTAEAYVDAIRESGISIYAPIPVGDPTRWIPTATLESILDANLRGMSLAGLALRTRSKVAKQAVCRVLGYPIPESFAKTRPRFPGQDFDTYVQKANNLQVWNDDLAASRRYVLIRLSVDDVVTKVKVVSGATLSLLDTTGTLTQKFQARCVVGDEPTELVVPEDTVALRNVIGGEGPRCASDPTGDPTSRELLSINEIFSRLATLVNKSFKETGRDQERSRGATLHELVCAALGYQSYRDDGQFPDVRHQLLEVKLQSSPTIDLGLVLPTSRESLDVAKMGNRQIRHCDVRYAIFYATVQSSRVTLTHLILTTGEAFFGRFPQFQGRVLNKKLQVHLPVNFFD